MIPEIRQRFFLSMAEKAKELPKLSSALPTPKRSFHRDSSLAHLSLRNQRRIQRLRQKKNQSDNKIISLLKQEVREHSLTREQFQAALEYLKHEHHVYKDSVKKEKEQLQVIADLKAQVNKIKDMVSSLSDTDKKTESLQKKIVSIESLIKKKEKELRT